MGGDRWLCEARALCKVANLVHHECSTWVWRCMIKTDTRTRDVSATQHILTRCTRVTDFCRYINPSTLHCFLLHHTSPLQGSKRLQEYHHVLLALCSRHQIPQRLTRCSLLCRIELNVSAMVSKYKQDNGWCVGFSCLQLPSKTDGGPG